MNTYECPGCGNTLTENDETCKYCGGKNPIYIGPKKKPTTYVQAYDEKGEKVVKNPNDSFGLGFLLGLVASWIGIILTAVIFKGKKAIKGSITSFIIFYVAPGLLVGGFYFFMIIISALASAASASHTNHIDMITSGMQLVEFFRCQLALL